MPKKIFVNIPVKDLETSIQFFRQLGFSFEPKYSDKNAACLVVSETIFVMIVIESYFKTFTTKEILDTRTHAEAILSFQLDTKSDVNMLADKAVELGARQLTEPDDLGWMYTRRFQDLDGHIWELFYIDTSSFQDFNS